MSGAWRAIAAVLPILLGGPLLAGAAAAQVASLHEGQCALTTVQRIGHRLDGAPGSGSAISFANGGVQVSYDELPGVQHSRVGDRVYLCLMRIPRGCPPSDARGRIYTTTNLRTLESWTAADSAHSCGGA